MVDKPRGSFDRQRIGAGQERIDPLRRQQRRANTKPRKSLPTRQQGARPQGGQGQQQPSKVKAAPGLAERMGEVAQGPLPAQGQQPTGPASTTPAKLGPSFPIDFDNLPQGAKDIIHGAIFAAAFKERFEDDRSI